MLGLMREDISWSSVRTSAPPKRKRGKKRKPKGGYVYLFERISFRSLRAIFTGQREIKIGITHRRDVGERLKEVDRAVVGKVIKIHEQWYDNPKKEESRLHEMFENDKFRPKAVRDGGGLSEWFLMNRAEFRKLKRQFNVSRGWYVNAQVYGLLLILIYVLYLILRAWLM